VSWVRLNSNLLAAARYDAGLKRLALKFHKGAIYYYLDVPAEVYAELLAAPSTGAFFVRSIRDEYRFVVVQGSAEDGTK
jgi:hypothetical protein